MPDPVPCPYKSLPDSAFWRRSISTIDPSEIDPIVETGFSIDLKDKVATAGSCFAQNIARYLRNSGGNYFVTEKGHPILSDGIATRYNYSTFTARFANIYTTRQMFQTLERAYGLRKPVDDIWREEDGRCRDPFRPFIQPSGFASELEYYADRTRHFAAIRQMVEQSDVFVFTLGLTEAWQNTQDGTVYAISPGCGAGQHFEGESEFKNFTVAEVTDDLHKLIAFMKERNPGLKILLTVSPVPLIATYSDQHVLPATVYSKSVLRVAAESARLAFDNVDYFPSYEVITAAFSKGAYYADDLRDVEEVGVNHAMRVFFAHYCKGIEITPIKVPIAASATRPDDISKKVNDVICDEARLEEELD